MIKFRKENISEKKLEDEIRKYPELIEEGLQFIRHQLPVKRGPLDVLFVDKNQALVVAELKIAKDDKMLTQALDYYDSVVEHKETITRKSKNIKIDPEKDPRILLIAPEFSETLRKRCKWIEVDIRLFRYEYLVSEDGAKSYTLRYHPVKIPAKTLTIDLPSLDGHLDYFVDNEIRNLATNLLTEVRSWDANKITQIPTKNYISLKKSGRSFGSLVTRQKFFFIDYLKDGEWDYKDVRNESDMKEALNFLRKSFDYLP